MEDRYKPDQKDFTYDCVDKAHEGDPIDLPDSLFPTPEQVKAGMNPEKCVNCNQRKETI